LRPKVFSQQFSVVSYQLSVVSYQFVTADDGKPGSQN